MKARNIRVWSLIAVLFLVVLTACATAAPEPTPIPPTATDMPPTATSLPPTEVPEPASCDEMESNCLELTFNGENCTYDGPAEHKIGATTFLFINESEKLANMSLGKHTGNETIQDTIDYWIDGPKHGHPSWAEWVFEEDASAGKSDTWEGILEPGTYFLTCAQGLPFKWWLGVSFTVEN